MKNPHLVPIVKTDMAPAFRTGQMQCWGARTTDGEWSFVREESSGTPWLIYHEPSVKDRSYTLPVMQCGTLRECRLAVGRGYAARDLERRKAERALKAAQASA